MKALVFSCLIFNITLISLQNHRFLYVFFQIYFAVVTPGCSCSSCLPYSFSFNTPFHVIVCSCPLPSIKSFFQPWISSYLPNLGLHCCHVDMHFYHVVARTHVWQRTCVLCLSDLELLFLEKFRLVFGILYPIDKII